MRKPALAVLAAFMVVAGCGEESGLVRLTVDTGSSSVELDIEIADSEEERRVGLMGRESLPERQGMLFRFPEEHRGGFWMKDTLIPLSIAFLDSSGRVLAILDMEPCRADPCPVYDPGVVYWSALEVNQGAFERLGVEPGDVVASG
jgi:uncharacterized membrane protein (UPF0127 family)